MQAKDIKYYDASPKPDHFTKEQIERVIRSLERQVEAIEERVLTTLNAGLDSAVAEVVAGL